MTRKTALLIFALATVALPCWAAAPSANRGTCSDIPLRLIVAPQTPDQGGISGDGLSIYNNPNDPAFNGGTQRTASAVCTSNFRSATEPTTSS